MLLLSVIECNQINQQCLRHIRQSQRNLRQHPHSLPRNLQIHIMCILIKLIQHIPQIILIRQHPQYLHFDILYISRLVNFTIKVFEVLLILWLAIHVQDHVLYVL